MPPEDTGLEVEETQQTPAEDRPEWLPPKFNSGEALAESYTHLESRLGQQGNELASERQAREAAEARAQELESLVAEQRTPQQPQYAQDPLVAVYEHAYEQGDTTTMLAVQAELAQRAAQATIANQPKQEDPGDQTDYDALAVVAEQQVRQEYGEAYDQLRDEVAQILQQQPDIVKGSTFKDFKEGIDVAFRLAQRDQLLQNQTKQAQQQAEQEASRAAKLAAQTATGAGTRPPTPDDQKRVWDEIKNATDGRWKGASA